MKKPWSISTTVRNPDRLRDFLSVLIKLEGEPFNSENQIKYQVLLIQKRLYKPTDLDKEQEKYFLDIEREMPLSVAQEIFNKQNYIDPAMRGRNSVAPLNKMGFCIAKNSADGVKITPLGKHFLSEDLDLGKLFFNHFLKWQLPNPSSRAFSESDGFSIKPFVATLHLIKETNLRWIKSGNSPIGISKDEFSLFVPTLINFKNIKEQAEKLVEYRIGLRSQKDDESKRKFKEKFRRNFARLFLETSDNEEIIKFLNNLKDYGDNTIRYFRLTRHLYIRGSGFYVDLEPRRSVEIEGLLSTDDASPIAFESSDDYIKYLADINQPALPWETKPELIKITENLSQNVQDYIVDLKSKRKQIPDFSFQKIESLGVEQLKQYIENLRIYRRKLQDLETHFESQDTSKIQKYIDLLKNIYQSSNKKSIELEKLSTLALNALNDAIEIKPNYPVGDDNEPTFTAPANKPDIECFYEKFNCVCEVTMLVDRSQWYNEGQPVQRHLRDFENLYTDKIVYCLFIAPKLHQDTIETFWAANKYAYRGARQRIIPFTITQFTKLLDCLLKIKKNGNKLKHEDLLNLYEQILNFADKTNNSDEWTEQIPKLLDNWQKSIL